MNIKVYNISDTRSFFSKLSNCSGNIELVGQDGMHICLSDPRYGDNLGLIAQTYIHGVIDELELSFSDSADAVSIIQYLAEAKVA